MDGDLLPDGRREMSVLFTNLEGFKGLAEKLGDEGAASLLAEYYDAVGRIVEKHGGVVDKLMGEGVLATFNAVAELEDHGPVARRAAEEIIAEVSRLTAGGGPLRAAVGVASGPADVRTFSAGSYTATTVVGGTVSRAAQAARGRRYGSVSDTDAK